MSAVLAPSPSKDDPPPPVEIQGLVDNATADRIYGWAWTPAVPERRVPIELRLGDTPVARTVADFARPDLAKAGIGDGCHAFELPLEPDWIRRRAELTVVGRLPDGSAQPIPMRVRRNVAEGLPAGLQRGLDALAAGQNRLAEQVHALAARLPGEEDRDAVRALARTQAELTERLQTLAIWLTRLDDRLAALPAPAPPPRPSGGIGRALLLLALGAVAAGAFVAAAGLLR